jgi:hypothetical protein
MTFMAESLPLIKAWLTRLIKARFNPILQAFCGNAPMPE